MRTSRLLIAFSLVSLASGAAHAQPGRRNSLPGQGAPSTPAVETPGRGAESRPAPPAVDNYKQTQHTTRIAGQAIAYTATAGTLALSSATGKARANVFFVAYTKDGVPAGSRPIAFVYNGGPGSASVWLHMGLVGPKRVKMADDGFQPAPPYELVENEESLLDVSDVVAIDAVSTASPLTSSSRPICG